MSDVTRHLEELDTALKGCAGSLALLMHTRRGLTRPLIATMRDRYERAANHLREIEEILDEQPAKDPTSDTGRPPA